MSEELSVWAQLFYNSQKAEPIKPKRRKKAIQLELFEESDYGQRDIEEGARDSKDRMDTQPVGIGQNA